MTETKRVLDADVYDTLELAAEAFGGVGRGQYFEDEDNWTADHYGVVPCCIQGMAMYATDKGNIFDNHISQTLFRARITSTENDDAFKKGETRIPFATWCKRLRVERGSDV